MNRTTRSRAVTQGRVIGVIAGALVALATLSCCIRLAWLWQAVVPGGGAAHHAVVLQHGAVEYDRTEGPAPPTLTTGLIFNRQIEFGVSFTLFRQNTAVFPAPGGGGTTQQSLVLPVWPPLLALGIALLVWRRRIIGRCIAGHCRCGYDLRGLPSQRCPECGTAA